MNHLQQLKAEIELLKLEEITIKNLDKRQDELYDEALKSRSAESWYEWTKANDEFTKTCRTHSRKVKNLLRTYGLQVKNKWYSNSDILNDFGYQVDAAIEAFNNVSFFSAFKS